MKTIGFVAVICAALTITTLHAAEGAETPSVTVRWLMDASADAAAEKGIVTVPVIDPAGDCASKFRVIGVSTWVIRHKGVNDLADVRSEISVSVRKLFEGTSPVPELTIIQSIDDLDLPAVISFREKNAVAKESWSAANAEFTEQFDASAIAAPPAWKRIELRCTN